MCRAQCFIYISHLISTILFEEGTIILPFTTGEIAAHREIHIQVSLYRISCDLTKSSEE